MIGKCFFLAFNSLEKNELLFAWTGEKLEKEHVFPYLILWMEGGLLAASTIPGSLLRTDFSFPRTLLPCSRLKWPINLGAEFQGTSNILIIKNAF